LMASKLYARRSTSNLTEASLILSKFTVLQTSLFISTTNNEIGETGAKSETDANSGNNESLVQPDLQQAPLVMQELVKLWIRRC